MESVTPWIGLGSGERRNFTETVREPPSLAPHVVCRSVSRFPLLASLAAFGVQVYAHEYDYDRQYSWGLGLRPPLAVSPTLT